MRKNIKQKFIAIAFLAIGILSFSCSQDELDEPSLSFTMEDTDGSEIGSGGTVKVNKQVVFEFEADAEYLTIWTGNVERPKLKSKVNSALDSVDASGNIVYGIPTLRRAYGDQGKKFPGETNKILRGQNVAFDVNTRQFSNFSYSYAEPGVYTVTVIASRSGDYGENIGKAIVEKQITVVE